VGGRTRWGPVASWSFAAGSHRNKEIDDAEEPAAAGPGSSLKIKNTGVQITLTRDGERWGASRAAEPLRKISFSKVDPTTGYRDFRQR